MSAGPGPLAGLRVGDLGDRVAEAASRVLGDLGADVVKLEPPGGTPHRQEAPVRDGESLAFAMRNLGKRSFVVDLSGEEARAATRAALGAADVVFLGPEEAEAVDVERLHADHPALVIVVSSPFGRTGPRATWQATDRTLLALTGATSRSGRPGGTPLVPPDGIATATAAAQAAWTALTAFLLRTRTGQGQVIDLAHVEAVATGLDPAFGTQGSAAAGRSGAFRRGRPPADSYPIYRCRDGYVRLALLAKRQWQGMFEWLGSPAEFADPKYASISARVADADRLEPLIRALFADRTAADIVAEAAGRGIPVAEVLTLGQALRSEHFRRAGAVAPTRLTAALSADVPTGFYVIDGERRGATTPSPAVPTRAFGSDAWGERAGWGTPAPHADLPFEGLRVLDLGVIVFGAEAGRAFADLGAEVIKVESENFPDGLRQTRGGEPINASFAWGNRGKRSLGLDLRTDRGRELFLDLAAESDVVLSNFKPGTLDSLGIGRADLAARNPRIIVLESAAFSSKGPWARRLGYGPLVRAACGVTSLWKYAAADVESWDGVTVYPDHVAAKLAAVGVVAALLARGRSGVGAGIEVAQSEVVLHHLGHLAAQEACEPGAGGAVGNRGTELFGGLFACAGDDEWCVVDARTPRELDLLADVVDVDHVADVETLSAALEEWASVRSPHEVMAELQAVGIPAAAMARLPEVARDPQLIARGTYGEMEHPLIDGVLPTENVAAPFGGIRVLPPRPAPLAGQDTVDICARVLGLGSEEIAQLVADRVVFVAGALVPSPTAAEGRGR